MFSSFINSLRRALLEPEPPHPLPKYIQSDMTVGERLHVRGRRDAFDRAARKGDKDEMVRLLQGLDLTPELIEKIIKHEEYRRID